jgi:hypothetical protein
MSETTTEQPFDPIENTPTPEETEPTVQTEAVEPEQEATEPADPETTKTDDAEAEPAEDADKRMARMAHEMREAKKQARQLKAELQELKGQRPPAEPDAELDRKVQERAEQLSRQKVFVDVCNDIYKQGVDTYGKAAWDSEIKELSSMAGQYVPPVIIEAAQDAGNPHQILHYLAENPDEYEVLLNQPVHKTAVQIAKIAAKLHTPKPVSKAPAPIRPVTGPASGPKNLETMPLDQYMREMNQRDRQRRGY